MPKSISKETVKYIAKISRLSLSDEEISIYQKDIDNMIQSFAKLENFIIPIKKQKKQKEEISQLRPDAAQNTITTEEFLSQSPDKEGGFVRVPAIL